MDFVDPQFLKLLLTVAAAGIGSWISARIQFAVALNDIKWIKKQLERTNQRIDAIVK